jgi:hypothetical protein
VDPGFIAGVVALRRACSVNDTALVLGCGRKRVLTALARLAKLGFPVRRAADAPRYRALTVAQREDATALHNNGHGLDFFALCRVLPAVHPLALFQFLRNEVGPRGWWVRPCAQCRRPFATPRPSVRFCSSDHGLVRRAVVSA